MVDFSRLEGMMEEEALDALILHGAKNVAYITGVTGAESWLADMNDLAVPIAVVAFPDKSFSIRTLSDIPSKSHGCDQILDARLTMLAGQLRTRGLHRGRIGVDMYYMPANSLAKLKCSLPEAQFVSADELILRMRASKTPKEVEYIRKAISATEKAFLEASKIIREGVTYKEVGEAWSKAVIDQGAFPMVFIPYSLLTRPEPKDERKGLKIDRHPIRAERGTLTRVDHCACYRGYYSDQKMTICVGEPSKEALDVFNDHVDRLNFMTKFIRPGMTKQEVYNACAAEFKHVEEYCWWIHGIGLDIHEEPRVGSLMAHSVNVDPRITFEKDTVVALEPSWIVEDDYILKGDGFERLGTLPFPKIWTF